MAAFFVRIFFTICEGRSMDILFLSESLQLELATHDMASLTLLESLHIELKLLDPLMAALTHEEAHDGY
jgi:hypothetical protein